MSFILEAIRSPAVVKKKGKKRLWGYKKNNNRRLYLSTKKRNERRGPVFHLPEIFPTRSGPRIPMDGYVIATRNKSSRRCILRYIESSSPASFFLFCILYFSLASVVVVGRHPSAFGCAGEKKGVVSYLYSRHRLCARRCASNRKWQIIKRNV